jgi:hypothetical protein
VIQSARRRVDGRLAPPKASALLAGERHYRREHIDRVWNPTDLSEKLEPPGELDWLVVPGLWHPVLQFQAPTAGEGRRANTVINCASSVTAKRP